MDKLVRVGLTTTSDGHTMAVAEVAGHPLMYSHPDVLDQHDAETWERVISGLLVQMLADMMFNGAHTPMAWRTFRPGGVQLEPLP